MASTDSLPDRVGRYEVKRLLGQGAMGRVLLAYDPVLDRQVAVKLLRSDLDFGPEVRDSLLARMRHEAWRVFVLTGDGELQEGSNWEAAMTAQHYGLDNLTVIVDRNGLQQGDFTEKTLRMEPLAERWRSFGFAVREIDGHDHAALYARLSDLPFEVGKPNCLIAHTVKGKGVSFAENKPEWHHGVPTAEQLIVATRELETEVNW